MRRRIEIAVRFAILLVFAAVLLAISVRPAEIPPPSPATAAAHGLIQRLIPKPADQFVVETIPSDNGRDVFEVESRDGKIVLRGNDAVSIASALNWYLEKDCHCDISWNCGDQLSLPKQLPAVPEKIRIVSPHEFRYAYNFCTHGYTMAWWDWPKWEHELDFLAMNGVNLALIIEGQESVWINTFTNFGYSAADIRGWVVDPAHQPWMYMDNMEDYGGLNSADKSSPGCASWASNRCCRVTTAWCRRILRKNFPARTFMRRAIGRG